MCLSYFSKSPGIGGTIKGKPEDFLVEEICSDGTILELDESFARHDEPNGRFVHFVLQKRDWSTSSAISEISKHVRVGHSRFNFAGTKDKVSISTQLASCFSFSAANGMKDAILSLKIKDMKILGAWLATDKVRLGSLLGNRFTVIANDCAENPDELVDRICLELGGKVLKFPNYFGEQRFGSTRKNTHLVGERMLQGRFDEAVSMFLCDTENEQNQHSVEARKMLAANQDYAAALHYFPKHLRLERMMIAHLAKSPGDYVGALKRLPRPTLLMFIHAFQSHIFNRLLSRRISECVPSSTSGISEANLGLEKGEYFCGETLGFPDISKAEADGWVVGKLIGYESPINDRERALLEELHVEKEAFRLKQIPEIACRGTYRTLLSPMHDFSFTSEAGSTSVRFRFSLQSGSYATMAMREFLDKKTI